MPQTTETKFKILIAALSQFSKNENDFLPTPDYNRLARDLGLSGYASAKGVWRRLRNELIRAGHEDLRIRNGPGRPRSPVRRRGADELIPRKEISKAEKDKVGAESDGEVVMKELDSINYKA
ncbi:89442efa-42e6-4855-bd97-f37a53cf1708 [Sclerotinia trifoliorum]|uniref:89442efa-42e6-4855-bd97-f37a53cf1708 n=1 Tax=Sclerotinia trifoliorum TaxID=28548 RepID=A0A8H2ZJI0_9HELO|nr:89442efa-42e6-4855-bd97-f37a53cf1708 [Sclerotinia trifoliorum]